MTNFEDSIKWDEVEKDLARGDKSILRSIFGNGKK